MCASADIVAESARVYIASAKQINSEVLTRWMSSPNREIRAIAFTLFVEYSELCSSIEARDQCKFVVATLEEALLSDQGDSYEYWFGRFDAMLYLNTLLRRWQAGSFPEQKMVDKLVELLAKLCLMDNGSYQQLVIDVTLEHIMMEERYRDLFSSWRFHKRLRNVFERGCEAAKSWSEQARECDNELA